MSEEKEIEYTCYMCGLKLKRSILMKKIQCLKCGSKIFYKEEDPNRIKEFLAR
ncbi:MAG TPA: DNA-directed RNA polymerase subunit P [Nautiliaceae bacterium]|nr:DNA-directed RNA polymerase subunit P [Nautiliaceae bacterium]